jgi:protein SCO1/2
MLNRRAFPPLLAIVSSGLVVTLWACSPTGLVVTPSPTTPPLNGAALDPATNLPELTFTRSDGGTFTTVDTRGRTSLFFFGYTHCADVCPLTLAELAQMRRTLGADADKVDMYFVTLDLARDTPERMSTYVANFPGVVGLIGSDAELAYAQSVFNIVATRRDLGDGDYMLDHTAAIYLVNSTGQIQLAYPNGTALRRSCQTSTGWLPQRRADRVQQKLPQRVGQQGPKARTLDR